MLIVLASVSVLWLAVAILVVAVCQMAARGDLLQPSSFERPASSESKHSLRIRLPHSKRRHRREHALR